MGHSYSGNPVITISHLKAVSKKKVRDPTPITPVIQKSGSSRLKGRFRAANAGGIPKLITCLSQPITTTAERALFAQLLPYHQTGKKIDFKGLLSAFNLAFSTQVMPQGVSTPNPQDMIFSKSHRHLKLYYKELQHAARVRENNMFNATLSSTTATTTQQSGPTQLSIKDTLVKHQQKQKAATSGELSAP